MSSKDNSVYTANDNKEVLDLIKQRLELGYKSYGHGLKVDENTQEHGTVDNSWIEMAQEELLDAIIYMSASLIRLRRICKDKNI
jgi:hypothetical protein